MFRQIRKASVRAGVVAVLFATTAAIVSTGCSKKLQEASQEKVPESYLAAGAGGGSGSGKKVPAADLGVMLAYEHTLSLRLPADKISERVQAVRAACLDARHGACAVLGLEQTALEKSSGVMPRASLQVRIVPEGVDALIALAGQGGQIERRETKADDLATAVRDNRLLQDRLRREHARLLEFQDRKDLKVADVLSLSTRIAQVEAELQAAEQDAAQQQRRLGTQLVTFVFDATRGQASRSEIGDAFADFGSIMAAVTAWLIRAVAAALPMLALLAIMAALVRAWRRRRRRAG